MRVLGLAGGGDGRPFRAHPCQPAIGDESSVVEGIASSPDACPDCGDVFHWDDCGGFNPPSPHGCGVCTKCCRLAHRNKTRAVEDTP